MIRKMCLTTVVGLAAMAAACAQPPTAEIGAAESAIAAAETAEAETYAADVYAAAQEAQSALQAEMTVQQEKFAPLRSYTKVTELAASAQAAAETAAQEAAAGKERVRAETAQLIVEAKAAVEEATLLLESAPQGKGSQADIAAMKADLAAVGLSLGEADVAASASNFTEARNKAESALAAAAKVKTSIEDAQAVQQGARPRPRA